MSHISRAFFLSIKLHLPIEVSFLIVWFVLVFTSVYDPWPFYKGKWHLEPACLVDLQCPSVQGLMLFLRGPTSGSTSLGSPLVTMVTASLEVCDIST